MERMEQLFQEMVLYFEGDPARIQHFVKVHSFARHIGLAEGLDAQTLQILEAAACVHDIGIREAERRYGRSDGKLQEQLGPDEAEKLLQKLCFSPEEIQRICYLVGHHHTYAEIQGQDYQILVEADFLVNFHEEGSKREAIQSCLRNIFRTETGKMICEKMFGLGK